MRHDSFNELYIVAAVVNSKSCKAVLVATWYRPPNFNIDILKVHEAFLQHIYFLKKDSILVGDTNSLCYRRNLPLIPECTVSEINDLFAIKQIFTAEPMRVTNKSDTLVDNTLSNCLH